MNSSPKHRTSRRQLIAIGLGIAIAAATFLFVLPRIADYREVWQVVQRLSWLEIGALVLATLLNLATFAPPWTVVLPELDFRRAFLLTQASTASTYLAPGGAAVGVALSYAMLRGWGYSADSIGLATALTGLWNQFALLGLPAVALGLLTLTKEQDPLLQSVALIALAVLIVAGGSFAGALSSPTVARRVGEVATRTVNRVLRLLRRGPTGWSAGSFVRFREEAVTLLARRWGLLTLTTLAGQLSVFVVFLVSLRVVHIPANEVSAVEGFAAWALARLVGSLPITPGGIGVVELGLTTALVGFGGRNADVVAAVLIYRFLTIVPTLVLGLIAGASWRRAAPAAP
jgi:uncharacterized protein (TIRG00374 family)